MKTLPPDIKNWDEYFAECYSILAEANLLWEETKDNPDLSAVDKEKIRLAVIEAVTLLKETVENI